MKYILIILTLVLFGCQEDTNLMQETKEVQQQLRVSAPMDVMATWHTEIESSGVQNSIYAYPTLEIKPYGKNQAIINQTDTVNLIGITEYYGFPLISGSLNDGILTHCQLYSEPITQMSYYICLQYTR